MCFYLQMLLAVLIFNQKSKKQINYKGLNFIYRKKYINADCLPRGAVLKTYAQNIIRKSQCEAVINGKKCLADVNWAGSPASFLPLFRKVLY